VTDEPRSEPGHATPNGYTSEEPAASVAHHDAVTHMDAHTAISDDDHGHAEPRLGPIDWGAWAYALVGAAAGLVVVALFFVAVSR
jgi:hypothetical protein